MSNSNETSSVDLNSIKTGWVLAILIVIGLVIVGFYFFNFNSHILKNEVWWKVFQNLSADTGNWGTFGDYVGGILNPIIAAFAFYLIAKTYELQKRELKLSTDALNDQVKLAALTALLNSNLTRISLLCSERIEFLNKTPNTISHNIGNARSNKIIDTKNFGPEEDVCFDAWLDENHHILKYIDEINDEIKNLTENNDELKKQIKDFLKEEKNDFISYDLLNIY